MNRWDLRQLLRALGLLLLAGGAFAWTMGPYEMACFYLFSPGGRFAYQGFGFGTLMFANVAAQTAAYYLLGGLGLVLGYGHLALRSWARPLAVALLWVWLVLGVVLLPLVALMLVTSKGVTTG
ncbi:MAG: hypothetical protein GX605_02160, partial [Chloroflexi bacterium]|nr:hypothetical protein [Chloroflexota bacterium]